MYRTPRPALVPALAAAALLISGSALSASPFSAPNNSWITVSGTVSAATPNTFSLDYAGRTLIVEMDDWDPYGEARPIAKGQKVVVNGRIDDGLFQRRTIEASSVYVKDLDTHYYASAADEEGRYYPYGSVSTYRSGDFVALTGRVKHVRGRELILDTGVRDIVIDTATMSYDPLDDEGLQKVAKGDRVSVTGTIDDDLFEKREMDATSIVVLRAE